jgi:hypothetical protein
LPQAAIELADIHGATVRFPAGETPKLPLRHQNEMVGQLIVSSRLPGEALSAREAQFTSPDLPLDDQQNNDNAHRSSQ